MFKEIFAKYAPERSNLIYILHDIQDASGANYVSQEAVDAVSRYLHVPPNHIYGVLTFYTMFSTKPRGKNVIRLCESPPCYLGGCNKILRKLKNMLGVNVGETTADGLFTLETCACLGVCGNAPVVMINNDMHGDLTEGKIEKLINGYKGGE
jgi:NADH-quinone oxidoreductase subunit E